MSLLFRQARLNTIKGGGSPKIFQIDSTLFFSHVQKFSEKYNFHFFFTFLRRGGIPFSFFSGLVVALRAQEISIFTKSAFVNGFSFL